MKRERLSEQIVTLHGDLHLQILEARCLPKFYFSPNFFVKVFVPQCMVARTQNSENPQWNESFDIPLAHPAANLEFHIRVKHLGVKTIGFASISASKIITGERISGWFDINGPNGEPLKPNCAINVVLEFTHMELNPLYKLGFTGGVPKTYFPLRKGNHVTLYQDAHVPEGMIPQIQLEEGKFYKPQNCWEDICHSILEAERMIYVVGWSVFHEVKLVREASRPLPDGGDLTLGDLLIRKTKEGVRVLVMVWEDKTSQDKSYFKYAGKMRTHGKETQKFFKHSSVTCVLAPRSGSTNLSFMKQQVVETIYTHHQKCVIVDTKASDDKRKIIAFLGGFDLCDGRYDTPEHGLFSDLDTDFHQPTIPAGTKAPRQPWHDLHCRIDGPAAYDVLMNFEQRWKKFVVHKRVNNWKDDALIDRGCISWILGPDVSITEEVIPKDDPALLVQSEDDREVCHVQIFRSIDSGSLKGFPEGVSDAALQNLICSKDVVIDKSIQTAYIHAIRSAQHFIYIENQYFLGSSYAWPEYKNAGADHLIPMELALKIASKIRAKERFAVYIVLPMWPEGDSNSGVIQEILYWQSQTMQMMYRLVAKELRALQIDFHPQDYLNFYCLGNRQKPPKGTLNNNGAKISDSYKNCRFMIYVHSKAMIVDDEYVIVGSANINQRSMAGTRDTEIAMGAYQPHHIWGAKHSGQIYGYRMSLWAEHLGTSHPWFKEAESLGCVRNVNEIAETNWKRYTSLDFTELQGHLLRYPLEVDADGIVGPLKGNECFPDVGGNIMGACSRKLPIVLTT